MPDIRKLRLAANLSQYALATVSGIDRTRLCLFENGHVTLRPEELATVESTLMKVIEERRDRLAEVLAGTD
jgi:transcriptional regulator with XRE-family HTH domain